MRARTGSAVRVDPWNVCDWVVWKLEVDDPEQRISEAYHEAGMGLLLAAESRETMVGFAARLGCVYEGCKDDGSYGSDNDPCYAWWIRVPQVAHAQRTARGWPLVVEECRQQLDRMFADGHHWHGWVDERRTRALSTGEMMPLLL
ncbi:hypothetical protein ACF08E_10790 [Streptomyces globisporus]|uniref:hypothetical protein n=1 Tax=Streptomyces globisporus TaxID=1908 RepID=UPI0036FE723C